MGLSYFDSMKYFGIKIVNSSYMIENNMKDLDFESVQTSESVEVYGARVHNLKNVDVSIPHNKLSVITGLSGCGKSSLAFDTIFAEGQRRYIDTFSSYARNMLGSLERPDVDKITGLSPVISIEQKTVNKNPRSTIGTTTEIYDFFRLLFARMGEARCYVNGNPMVKYTQDKIIGMILNEYDGRKIYILAPLVKNRKGHYKDLFENLRKKGYLYVRVDGEIKELVYGMKLNRYQNHSVELVVDRLRARSEDMQRLKESVGTALRQGGKMMAVIDTESDEMKYFSQMLMDPESGVSYPEPAPHNFSFNSPQGACRRCKGLGYVNLIDEDKIIPDKSKSIHDGAIVPLGKYKNTFIFWQIEAICAMHGCTLKTPVAELPAEALDDILNGTDARLEINNDTMSLSHYDITYEGVVKYIEMQQSEDAGADANKWSGQFFSKAVCPECNGNRLNPISLHFFIDGKSIADVASMDIAELYKWTQGLENRLDPHRRVVAEEILKEIRSRLRFLLEVGLDYLSLNRSSSSLSGGESQRIRLATQIGSELVNVLYILDEPSIGLHQRDNVRLINSLKQLRDNGNSIIVVEHDKDIMKEADYVVDIGPGAGHHGGEVVYQGSPEKMLETDTLTASYLNGAREIAIPEKRRKGNGRFLKIRGATGHNLKNTDLSLPLGMFVCVTGVSGSGKSSLVNSFMEQERHIVTDIAGTTRDSIYTRYNKFGFDFYLVDTAGIRKKNKVNEDIEYYSVIRSIRAIEASDVCLLMIDATRGIEAQDVSIFSLIQRNKKGFVVVVNKWDLVEDKSKEAIKHYEEAIRARFAPFIDFPIIFASALTKQRIFKVLETALDVCKNRQRIIPTSQLNTVMLEVISAYPPPANKGKFVRIKYVTMLKGSPIPTFIFFCNLPQWVKEPYRRYLENKIRENWDFHGTPINIFMREK